MVRCDRCGYVRPHNVATCFATDPVNNKTTKLRELWPEPLPLDVTEKTPEEDRKAHDELLKELAEVTGAQVQAGNTPWPTTPTPGQRSLAADIMQAVQKRNTMFGTIKLTRVLAEAAVAMLGPGYNAGAAAPAVPIHANVFGSRQKCDTCDSTDHTEKNCPTCKQCGRPGHSVTKCPYGKICSNCNSDHAEAKDQAVWSKCGDGCQVVGCDSKSKTWDHPHKDTDKITRKRRAVIAGEGQTKKDPNIEDPPPAKAICADKLPSQFKDRRITDYACHNDSSLDRRSLTGDEKTSVITNYVAVTHTPSKVYVYNVVFANIPSGVSGGPSRPIAQRSQKARIFEALQGPGRVLQGRQDWATNYEQLWTLQPLSHTQNSVTELDVTYTKPGGFSLRVPHVEFNLSFELALSGDPLALSDVAGDAAVHEPHVIRRALNALLTKHVTSANNSHDEVEQVGENMFFVKVSTKDITGVHLARGYFTSIRPGSSYITLNVNVTHAAFFAPLRISEYLDTMGHKHWTSEYGDPRNYLKGRTVRLTYQRSTTGSVERNNEANRTKVIAGFGDRPHLQQFISEKKRYTVAEWFALQGYPVTRKDLPCVNVGLARPRPESTGPDDTGELWIPAEYLELPAFQPFTRKLGPTHMKEMQNTAVRHPAANHQSIVEKGLKLLGLKDPGSSKDLQRQLQIVAGKGLLHIPAKVLQQPEVRYSSTKKTDVQLASWNLKFATFQSAAKIPELVVLDLRTLKSPEHGSKKSKQQSKDPMTPHEIGEDFNAVLSKHGIQVEQEPIVIEAATYLMAPGGGPTMAKNFREKFQALLKKKNLKSPFVLVLLENMDVTMYNAIKSASEVYMGFHTVCVTKAKLASEHGIASLWSNLALKFNIRGGGLGHVVKYGNDSAFRSISGSTLVLGADVAHNGGFVPSVAAVVGSIDNEFVKMPGSSRLQDARTEIIPTDNMEGMARERLVAYFGNNGHLPQHILYFRDGVGEDQYTQVLNTEVRAIEVAYREMKRSNDPDQVTITVVVVGKRHHTRFFAPSDNMTYPATKDHSYRATKPDDATRYNGNMKPGLVVDSVITLPSEARFRDFFLQSHQALHGTARSAHYVVLRNDVPNKLSFHEIQRLSHAFCYTFARATKGVSYCAPAYNADRLCDRVNRYLRFWMDEHNNKVSQWSQQPGETDVAFRTRICNSIATDPTWNMRQQRDRFNPWHPNMDNVMFFL